MAEAAPVRVWKVLGPARTPYHGGDKRKPWPPPGEWCEVKGELRPCRHGLHLCGRGDLVQWLGPQIWEAEYDPMRPFLLVDGKIIAGCARLLRLVDSWTDETARRFAADCAEHVLPIFECTFPGDLRPRKAIETAKRYAAGGISLKELSAAWSAALSADAALSAAWSTALSADAALSAARSASRSADAALSEEYIWQTDHLFILLYGDANQ